MDPGTFLRDTAEIESDGADGHHLSCLLSVPETNTQGEELPQLLKKRKSKNLTILGFVFGFRILGEEPQAVICHFPQFRQDLKTHLECGFKSLRDRQDVSVASAKTARVRHVLERVI